MKGRKWTEKELQILAEQIKDKTYQQVAEILGRTKTAVKSMCIRLGYKQGGVKYKRLSKEGLDFIMKHFATMPSADIMQAIGCTKSCLSFTVKKYGLKKDPKYMSKMGKDRLGEKSKCTQFKKGHKPWNANIKNNPNNEQTRFKVGRIPSQTNPIGTIKKRRDGTYIKVGMPKKWMPIQRKIWLDAGREIPHGHIVIFKDRDQENLSLDNLMCVSRSNLARFNVGVPIVDDATAKVIYWQRKLQKRVWEIKRELRKARGKKRRN